MGLLAVPMIILPLYVVIARLPFQQRIFVVEGIVAFLAMLGLCLAGWQGTRKLLRRALAVSFLILNIFALLINVVIPMLPPIGEQKELELCVGLQGSMPTVQWSRIGMVVGPCFRFDVSFIDRRGTPGYER